MACSLFAKLHRRFGPKPSGDELSRRSLRKREEFRTHWGLPAPGEVPRSTAKRAAKPSVAIVGGGFAGLSAAYHLQNRRDPFPVTVYESSRIGGRVYSVRDVIPGRTVEKGGELIGMNHPCWIDLAQAFGLGLSVITSEDQASAAGLELSLFLDEKISPQRAKCLYDDMNRTLSLLWEDARTILDKYKPWNALNAAEWDKMTVAQKFERELRIEKGSLLWKALEVELSNDNVAPLEKQSYLGLLSLIRGGAFTEDDDNAYWTQSEVYRCENGNDTLAWSIRDWLTKRNCPVKETTEVLRISLGQEKASVTSVTGQRQETIKYDFVILAIPQGAWPGTVRAKLKIEPAIPRDYLISTGRALKYIATQNQRNWIPDGLNPSGMSNRLGLTWETTDNQIGGDKVGLTVFVGGPLADQAANAPDKNGYFTERIRQLYPHYEASSSLPKSFMDWNQVDLINEGYSCPAPGEVCGAAKKLSEPFGPNGRLLFAGEHTCMPFFGFMEGALQSGVRAASALALRYP
jgi:monoamine oxidase